MTNGDHLITPLALFVLSPGKKNGEKLPATMVKDCGILWLDISFGFCNSDIVVKGVTLNVGSPVDPAKEAKFL